MLKGINDAYQAGYFRRFGLSNFTVQELQGVYDTCKAKGYVLPSVYQGNYSAVARRQETELFPTLRKLGMSFYAYSPIAGGFLSKTREQLTEGKDAGRFAAGHPIASIYNSMYADKDSYLKALDLWAKAADAAGCSRAELAYRWVTFDSPLSKEHGDAIIFGSSTFKQIEETLGWLKKGSVGKEAKAKIDEIWKIIEHEAPLDNYNSFVKHQG
jgi:aflatoxin B1 aldehyde reductase